MEILSKPSLAQIRNERQINYDWGGAPGKWEYDARKRENQSFGG